MITTNDICLAFQATTVKARVESIDSMLAGHYGENGDKANGVYEIISNLGLNGFDFNTLYIHSDSGIKDFFIVFKMGNFPILAHRYQYPNQSALPFNNLTEFVNWLNKLEKKIKASATLISLA